MRSKQKTIFVARHGESEWNRAKANLRYVIHGPSYYRLAFGKDHALTSKGIQQAKELNTAWKTAFEESSNDDNSEVLYDDVIKVNDPKEFARLQRQNYTKQFRNANKIYSAPFTRAIETAVIALKDHPAFSQNGLTLLSSIRENKTMLCFDATGKKIGDEIIPRVTRKLTQHLGEEETNQLMESVINHVDISDVQEEWWLPTFSGNEKKKQIEERIQQFIELVHNCKDSEVPIFVGHSQFFKAFYSNPSRIDEALEHNRPEFVEKMRRCRLGNGALMAITLSFHESVGGFVEAKIVDADILFGGNFQDSH